MAAPSGARYQSDKEQTWDQIIARISYVINIFKELKADINGVCALFRNSACCLFSRARTGRGCFSRAGRPPDPVATGNMPRVRGCHSFPFMFFAFGSCR
jgi:hypothetical protein